MTRKEETTELIYKDESYAIIGACFELCNLPIFAFKDLVSFGVFGGQMNF